jgi:tetratricopeptide (TPR) repeat protein
MAATAVNIFIGPPGVALTHMGRAEEALRVLQSDDNPAPQRKWLLACYLAHLDKGEQVAALLKELALDNQRVGITGDDGLGFGEECWWLDAAVTTGNREAASQLLQHFSTGDTPPFANLAHRCSFRLLAAAKALVGRHEEARADYEKALKACIEFRFRPEVALTRLGLAELMLEHYPKEKKEALEHLDFAIKEFREMKMQPSLERALRHKEILKA